MKKKSIAARLGVAAMALTLVTTSLTSGTLAKYTTQVDFTATALIARWNPTITANGTAVSTSGTKIKFSDLMKTKMDGLAPGTIAPGTSGELPIVIDMTGGTSSAGSIKYTEVDSTYEIWCASPDGRYIPANLEFSMAADFAADKTVTPISANPGDPDQLYGTKLTVDSESVIKAKASAKQELKLYWRWLYDNKTGISADTSEESSERDENDTVAAQKTDLDIDYTFTVVITQKAPTPTTAPSA